MTQTEQTTDTRLAQIPSWRTSDAMADVMQRRRILVNEEGHREETHVAKHDALQRRVCGAKEAYRTAIATEALGGASSDVAAQTLHAAERELALFEQRSAQARMGATLDYFDSVISGDLLRSAIAEEAEALTTLYRAHVPDVRRLLEALLPALTLLEQCDDRTLTDLSDLWAPALRHTRPVHCAMVHLPLRASQVQQALHELDRWEAQDRARR